MSTIKPQVHLSKEGQKTEYKYYKTYRLLKKDLNKFVKEYDEVFVVRSRRGEWGEWFERFVLENNKLKIIEEGWL